MKPSFFHHRIIKYEKRKRKIIVRSAASFYYFRNIIDDLEFFVVKVATPSCPSNEILVEWDTDYDIDENYWFIQHFFDGNYVGNMVDMGDVFEVKRIGSMCLERKGCYYFFVANEEHDYGFDFNSRPNDHFTLKVDGEIVAQYNKDTGEWPLGSYLYTGGCAGFGDNCKGSLCKEIGGSCVGSLEDCAGNTPIVGSVCPDRALDESICCLPIGEIQCTVESGEIGICKDPLVCMDAENKLGDPSSSCPHSTECCYTPKPPKPIPCTSSGGLGYCTSGYKSYETCDLDHWIGSSECRNAMPNNAFQPGCCHSEVKQCTGPNSEVGTCKYMDDCISTTETWISSIDCSLGGCCYDSGIVGPPPAPLVLTLTATSFVTIGDAGRRPVLSNQYLEMELTRNDVEQIGGAWSTDNYRVDVSRDFQIKFKGYFGSDIYGGDGIVFAIQTDARGINALGTVSGHFLGYGIKPGEDDVGVSPSIGVEFDTYQYDDNGDHRNDISVDHIAVLRNGNILEPISDVEPALRGAPIDDGQWHDVAIKYETSTRRLYVFFDGIQRLVTTLSESMFDTLGQSKAYWGFTSATWSATNNHKVKLHESTYLEYL